MTEQPDLKARVEDPNVASLRRMATSGEYSSHEEAIFDGAADRITDLEAERDEVRAKLNLPEVANFLDGVALEAAHQRERWAASHDAGKEPEDWLWLLGWLAGKAVRAARDGDLDKARHHTISSAAVLANWHAAITGANNAMRPGIDAQEHGYVDS